MPNQVNIADADTLVAELAASKEREAATVTGHGASIRPDHRPLRRRAVHDRSGVLLLSGDWPLTATR